LRAFGKVKVEVEGKGPVAWWRIGAAADARMAAGRRKSAANSAHEFDELAALRSLLCTAFRM